MTLQEKNAKLSELKTFKWLEGSTLYFYENEFDLETEKPVYSFIVGSNKADCFKGLDDKPFHIEGTTISIIFGVDDDESLKSTYISTVIKFRDMSDLSFILDKVNVKVHMSARTLEKYEIYNKVASLGS